MSVGALMHEYVYFNVFVLLKLGGFIIIIIIIVSVAFNPVRHFVLHKWY